MSITLVPGSIVDDVSAEQGSQALLRLLRCSPEDIRYRECLIFLDGKQAANLKYGDEVTMPIETGVHTVFASNRMSKTKPLEFTVLLGEVATFESGNVATFWYNVMMWAQIPALPGLFLRRVGPPGD